MNINTCIYIYIYVNKYGVSKIPQIVANGLKKP